MSPAESGAVPVHRPRSPAVSGARRARGHRPRSVRAGSSGLRRGAVHVHSSSRSQTSSSCPCERSQARAPQQRARSAPQSASHTAVVARRAMRARSLHIPLTHTVEWREMSSTETGNAEARTDGTRYVAEKKKKKSNDSGGWVAAGAFGRNRKIIGVRPSERPSRVPAAARRSVVRAPESGGGGAAPQLLRS